MLKYIPEHDPPNITNTAPPVILHPHHQLYPAYPFNHSSVIEIDIIKGTSYSEGKLISQYV